MKRILISDRTHEVLPQRLREAGFDVLVEPDHDYESLVAAAQGCVGLVVRSKVDIDSFDLDGFIDWQNFGLCMMEQDGVISTQYGVIRRVEPEQPEQEAGMQLQSL